jgi:hypothetical protein
MSDDSVLVRIKPITFEYPITYYVPVFQKNFTDEGDPKFSLTFTYSLSEASQDEQMAWSFNPDYVLELSGYFKATTKPFLIKAE